MSNPCSRFHEFFEVNGVYAMRNMTVFITIMVASVVVLWLALIGELTAEIFGCYVFAGGGVYGFGKFQDEKTKREGNGDGNSDSSVS